MWGGKGRGISPQEPRLKAQEEQVQSHQLARGPWERDPRQKPNCDITGSFPLLNLLKQPTSSVAKPKAVGNEIL